MNFLLAKVGIYTKDPENVNLVCKNLSDESIRKLLRGYKLSTLVNDEDERVRRSVASMGYGIDKLIKDKDLYVRNAAKKKLKEISYE